MVSVPSEGSVSSSVCSVVHMVRTGVRGSSGRSISGGTTGRSSAVITSIGELRVWGGGGLVTVFLLSHPCLSGEAGVLDDREASEVGLVHAICRLLFHHQESGHQVLLRSPVLS